jgi:hypothetical protein
MKKIFLLLMVLPVADIFNLVWGYQLVVLLTFLSLKGINISAQGIALRHQDRFRTPKRFKPNATYCQLPTQNCQLI